MLADPLKAIVHPADGDAHTVERKELRRQLSDLGDRMRRGRHSDSEPPTERGQTEKVDNGIGSPCDMDGLLLYPPEPRKWIVQDWLPRGVVTMLFSVGGLGKTLITQQLGTCVAAGLPWLNLPVVQGKVIAIMCEENDNDVRWRQKQIMEALDPMGALELPRGSLSIYARLGQDNLLMRVDGERNMEPTRFLTALEEKITANRPDLVILDNVAQLFGGIENDRSQVTQFVNRIARLALEVDCALLLLGHVAKAGGSNYSGSTAWENVARVRWLLERDKDDTSTLSVKKSNVGPRPTLPLAYRDGVFIPQQLGASSAATRELVTHLIGAIREMVARGLVPTLSNPRATGYAPKALEGLELTGGYAVGQIVSGVKRMIVQGLLAKMTFTKSGKTRQGLNMDESKCNQYLSDNVLKGKDSGDLA